MDPSWPDDYPDKTALKREARAMAEAFAEALLAHVPSEHVAGIYWKGSAQKEWTTPIDYVPELSDVDIHVLEETPSKFYLVLPVEKVELTDEQLDAVAGGFYVLRRR